jgi:hypothetical protein
VTEINSFRLYLAFLNGLESVEVLASSHRIHSPICILGKVEGKAKLKDLFERCFIDHYFQVAGDPLSGGLRAVAHEADPQRIVDGLDTAFVAQHNLELSILEGQSVESTRSVAPETLIVCASSLSVQEGLSLAEAWFTENRV